MSTIGISGTILAARYDGERTILKLASGGNGGKRQDDVVLPGHRATLSAGKMVKLVNFTRSAKGELVPGENAKLKVTSESITKEAAPKSKSAEEPAPAIEKPKAHEPQSRIARPLPPPPALAPVPKPADGLMAFSDRPTRQALFNRAVEVAREFAEHIRKSGQIIKIQGRDYVTVAGWALLPAFESANCYTVGHTLQPDGTIIAEAIVERNGQMVSRGFGACSEKDRPKVNDRLAMAQTRARGSALKARYSVLVTLAGYEASLADEVDDARRQTIDATPSQPPSAVKKPTSAQLEFALKAYDNDRKALLTAVADAGLVVFELEDVPLTVLKAVVERRLNEKKKARAEEAAGAAGKTTQAA